jgi:hypothetical protein
MTDRERILEQVEWAEERAGLKGTKAARKMKAGNEKYAVLISTRAAHHALTALALRDAVDQIDEFCVGTDAPDDGECSLSEYQATPGL